MRAVILYASKYGSTREISVRLAEKLTKQGLECCLKDASDKPNIDGYDVIVLGSGIYGHKFLPELEQYINVLYEVDMPMLLFGVAIRTDIISKNGREFGGVKILEKYASQLTNGHILGMVHGRRIEYDKLDERDRTNLDKFYKSIGLSEEQILERKGFKDLISDKEIDGLAEGVLNFAGSKV